MGVPVLWHLKVSNYNEKARWALDFKGIPHERRAVEPGRHRAVAQRLTGGRTFPVLVLDDEPIGDSTRIIEALEERCPEPPLYPPDAEARERALDLEEFFDEELGPYVRLLVIHHLLDVPGVWLGAFLPDLPRARRAAIRAAFPVVRWRLRRAFGIDRSSVDGAYAKLAAAGKRLRAELGPEGYLVGDRFTVADLTAAAMAGPAVAPEHWPYAQPQRGHPALEPLRVALGRAGILDFTRVMYARHRGTSAAVR
jgi:glutathione S-transferase